MPAKKKEQPRPPLKAAQNPGKPQPTVPVAAQGGAGGGSVSLTASAAGGVGATPEQQAQAQSRLIGGATGAPPPSTISGPTSALAARGRASAANVAASEAAHPGQESRPARRGSLFTTRRIGRDPRLRGLRGRELAEAAVALSRGDQEFEQQQQEREAQISRIEADEQRIRTGTAIQRAKFLQEKIIGSESKLPDIDGKAAEGLNTAGFFGRAFPDSDLSRFKGNLPQAFIRRYNKDVQTFSRNFTRGLAGRSGKQFDTLDEYAELITSTPGYKDHIGAAARDIALRLMDNNTREKFEKEHRREGLEDRVDELNQNVQEGEGEYFIGTNSNGDDVIQQRQVDQKAIQAKAEQEALLSRAKALHERGIDVAKYPDSSFEGGFRPLLPGDKEYEQFAIRGTGPDKDKVIGSQLDSFFPEAPGQGVQPGAAPAPVQPLASGQTEFGEVQQDEQGSFIMFTRADGTKWRQPVEPVDAEAGTQANKVVPERGRDRDLRLAELELKLAREKYPEQQSRVNVPGGKSKEHPEVTKARNRLSLIKAVNKDLKEDEDAFSKSAVGNEKSKSQAKKAKRISDLQKQIDELKAI